MPPQGRSTFCATPTGVGTFDPPTRPINVEAIVAVDQPEQDMERPSEGKKKRSRGEKRKAPTETSTRAKEVVPVRDQPQSAGSPTLMVGNKIWQDVSAIPPPIMNLHQLFLGTKLEEMESAVQRAYVGMMRASTIVGDYPQLLWYYKAVVAKVQDYNVVAAKAKEYDAVMAMAKQLQELAGKAEAENVLLRDQLCMTEQAGQKAKEDINQMIRASQHFNAGKVKAEKDKEEKEKALEESRWDMEKLKARVASFEKDVLH